MADAPEGVDTHTELGPVFAEHAPRLWRAVFAFTGDREVASDAVAEALAQVLDRGEGVRSPERWVWRAAFRIAAGGAEGQETAPAVQMPSYEIPEVTDELVRALRAVSPMQRAALILHYYADLPVRDIAAAIGSSAATVRVHLSTGRKRLRQILKEGDDRPA